MSNACSTEERWNQDKKAAVSEDNAGMSNEDYHRNP